MPVPVAFEEACISFPCELRFRILRRVTVEAMLAEDGFDRRVIGA